MKRPLDKALGTVSLAVALFFVLVCQRGFQDLFSSDSSDIEGTIIALFFCLSVTGLSAYIAWVKLYRNRQVAKQQSRDDKLRQIVHLARQKQGTVSALEAAMDTGLEIEESKELLEYLVDKGLAVMNVNEHAAIIFNFPDLKTTAELIPLDRSLKTRVRQQKMEHE